jgi:hypothetical protein
LRVVVLIFADGGYGTLRDTKDKQYGDVAGRV